MTRLVCCQQALFGRLAEQAYHASERKNQIQLDKTGASNQAEGKLGGVGPMPMFLGCAEFD